MTEVTTRTRLGATTLDRLGRRLRGNFDIDEWGLDPELVSSADPILSLRWDIEVTGGQHLPTTGGALVVFNRRLGLSEPWVLARGIRRSTGRFVRTVGVPDHAPVGPFLRRFGAVLDRPDEIEGLLRAGQVVGLPMSRWFTDREAGSIDVERIEAAVDTGRPVVPAALVGREVGRHWRVVVGEPLLPARSRSGRSSIALTDRAQRAVQSLLHDAAPAGWWS